MLLGCLLLWQHPAVSSDKEVVALGARMLFRWVPAVSSLWPTVMLEIGEADAFPRLASCEHEAMPFALLCMFLKLVAL